jgi:toxin YoeB
VKLIFSGRAWADYLHWQIESPAALQRVNELIEECRRTPFKGKGKPEPLKGELRGWWSRRITSEHRIVYRVAGSGADQQLEMAQCRFRY